MTAKLEKPIKREVIVNDKTMTVTVGPRGVHITEKGCRSGAACLFAGMPQGDSAMRNVTADVVK